MYMRQIVLMLVMAAVCYGKQLPLAGSPLKTSTYNSKRGSIKVLKYEDGAGFPRYRILTKHYEIYSEFDPEIFPPQELGMILEAEYEQCIMFYGVKPKFNGERWPVELYADSGRFAENCPGYGGATGVYFPWTKTAHTYFMRRGPSWWTRALMIHECSHQFHDLSGVQKGDPIGCGSSKFKFVIEGVATFVEGHRWDKATETLEIGCPLPGRSRSGIQKGADRPRTFEAMILADIERDETFNLMMFLIHKHPEQMKKLLRDPGDPTEAWRKAFGTTDMPESFWQEYADFCKKIGDESLTQNPKAISFKGWKGGGTAQISAVDPMEVFEAVEAVVGVGTIELITKVKERISTMRKAAEDSKRSDAQQTYARNMARFMSQAVPAVGEEIWKSSLDDGKKMEAMLTLLGVSAEASVMRDPQNPKRVKLEVTFVGNNLPTAAVGKTLFEVTPTDVLKAQRFYPISVTLVKSKPRTVSRSFLLASEDGKPFDLKVMAKFKCGRLPLRMIVNVHWEP